MTNYGTQVKTYSADNRLTITCPIFGVETELRACLKLDELVMKGQRPEVRHGCQAAMRCSKCPIWHIKQEIRSRGVDPYFSAELKHGALSGFILERIAPIIVLESAIESGSLSEIEKAKLHACNEMARKGVRPVPKKATSRKMDAQEKIEPTPVDQTTHETVEAAMRGDMTAAVNAVTRAVE